MCVTVSPACVSMHRMCTSCKQRLETNSGSPGTGIVDGCEPLCGAKNQNLVSGRKAAVFDHSSMSPAPSNHSLRREVQWEKDEESKHILERMPRVCLDIKTSVDLVSLYNRSQK